MQLMIEEFVFDEFNLFYSSKKKEYFLNGINTDLLNPKINKFILHKMDIIIDIVGRLIADKTTSKSKEKQLINEIISNVGKNYIINLVLLKFLLTLSYQHIEDDKNCVVVSVILALGGKLIKRYKNNLKAGRWGGTYQEY